MSNTDNSTIVTDPFHNCDEEAKKKCLADIQKVRDNDPNYKELDWTGKNVGADGAKVLAEALTKNSSVTHIDLDTSGIGANGAKAIAEALKNNSSVTNINLWGNKLGADGAKAIAEALKKNSSVTKINLRYNDIGDDGAKEIAEALKKNSSVNDINLSSNAIGADGGMAIAQALAENLSVTYIYLHGNNISPTDEALIISKTASNQILKKHQEDVQRNKNVLNEKRKKMWELDDPEGDDSEAYELLDEEIRVLRAKFKNLNQEDVQKNKNELKEKRKKIRELDDPDGDDSEAYELLDEEIRVLRAKFKILNKSEETNTQPTYPIPQQQSTFPPQQIIDRSSNSTRRLCSFNLCPNKIVQGGRCVAHGAKRKKCSHPGCLKHVKKAGMCSAHGAPRKRCDVIGCEKISVQAGRCNSHGVKKKLCSAEGCQKQAILSGICKQHNNERCIEKDQKGVENSPKAKDDSKSVGVTNNHQDRHANTEERDEQQLDTRPVDGMEVGFCGASTRGRDLSLLSENDDFEFCLENDDWSIGKEIERLCLIAE